MKAKKPLTLAVAANAMRKGALLQLMHANVGGTPNQRAYYVVPAGDCRKTEGGAVSEVDAAKLIARLDVFPHDNGLIPGHPQSWKLGG